MNHAPGSIVMGVHSFYIHAFIFLPECAAKLAEAAGAGMNRPSLRECRGRRMRSQRMPAATVDVGSDGHLGANDIAEQNDFVALLLQVP